MNVCTINIIYLYLYTQVHKIICVYFLPDFVDPVLN